MAKGPRNVAEDPEYATRWAALTPSYCRHAGLCLETQHFPDSIHHEGESGWPSIVLRTSETYRHSTVHRFMVE